jgi:carboxyl-terminal processing protease
MMSRRMLKRALPLTVVATLAWLGGWMTHSVVEATVPRETPPPYAQLETFARVLSHIETRYVDPVATDELVYGAIKGLVDTLDPHSTFLTPAEHRAMRNETRGEYVGVGMELSSRDGDIVVVAPFEGGPAFEAGIEPGDVVVEVDGTRTRDLTLQDVVTRLRGERGLPVTITVRRGEGTGATELSFLVVRDVIRVQAVTSRLLRPGVGYVSVSTFQLGVTDDVLAALDAMTAENRDELRGVVLDLRNNPGGLLSEGIGVSDLFLDEGLIVTTEGRDPEENESHRSRDGSTRYLGPLAVLVNGGTASASEIVAGALQDRGRATVIGTLTFGKATVQSIIDFDDGSGLKLTVARYYTPNHEEIHGVGIRPDVEVGSQALTISSDELVDGFDPVTDAQLRAALQALGALR